MKRRLDLERYAPVGYDWRRELKFFAGGLIGAFLYGTLRYGLRLRSAYDSLYYLSRTTGQRILREGVVMEDFAVLIDRCLSAFPLIALMMAFFAVLHYAYHRRGSRSDYTMRRLPDRWEMHRRCLAIPVTTALICLIAGFAMLLIYYGIYMLVTPEQCLTQGQWAKIWTMEVRS